MKMNELEYEFVSLSGDKGRERERDRNDWKASMRKNHPIHKNLKKKDHQQGRTPIRSSPYTLVLLS